MVSLVRWIVGVVVCAVGLCEPVAGASGVPSVVTFRAQQPWIERLLAAAPSRAPTLRALMARLLQAPVIVYLDEATAPDTAWDGRTIFVTLAGGFRYVRVELRRQPAPFAAAVLAHELQHIGELLAGQVRGPEDMRALFGRIGFVMGERSDRFETEAAIDVGLRTLHELVHEPVRMGARTAAALRHHRLANAAE